MRTIQSNFNLTSLCRALTNGEFFYFYQPIISLENGTICGAEALIRWKQADGSIVMPASFLPLAQDTGFIAEMTRELLPKLLADLRQINEISPFNFVHYNLSTADLQMQDLSEFMITNLSQAEIQPGNFRVEIVESVFLPLGSQVEGMIGDLAAKSIPVILNDFSAGYTTLKVLSQLPLTAIKLALQIVQRATKSRKDFRILRHLVNMGHQLDLAVITEGIETEEMYDLTLSTGSTYAQGYYFSYPLPLHDYLNLLQKGSNWLNYPFGMEYLTQVDLIDFRRDVVRAALAIRKYKDEEARQRAIARLPELDYRKSDLGIWFSDVGQEWAQKPEFEEFREEHQHMHETAYRLVQAAVSDEPLEMVNQLIHLLSEQSSRIARFLHEIELNGLKKHYRIND